MMGIIFFCLLLYIAMCVNHIRYTLKCWGDNPIDAPTPIIEETHPPSPRIAAHVFEEKKVKLLEIAYQKYQHKTIFTSCS